jgi:glycosyltransferase involved in cell wall biosynthesis
VINDLVTDQRVHRVANLLLDHGMIVTCIGRRLQNSPVPGEIRFHFRRFRMLFIRGPLFYACFNARLFFTLLLVRRPVLFISNDLDTLPANFLASRIRRVKLIYDSHELFTQVPELIHRKRIQSIWKWIEYTLVPRLEYAVTVSYPIAEIYRRLYGTRFRVVRNVPERIIFEDENGDHGSSQGNSVIIYQGALNVGRGLEIMIETMRFLDHAVLILAGTGDIEEDLKRKVQDLNLGDRVEFRGRMSPEKLTPLTRTADLGISLEEDLGLNYRYALPNKLFDYIQCRVPVLCSALPEMSKIVEAYGIGVVVRNREPQNLARVIRFMLKERASGAWREALEKAANELCWENESEKYLKLLVDAGIMDRI